MSDEFAVMRTLHAHCIAQDDRDIDRVVDCYTEDCVFELSGLPTSGRFEGHAGVRELHTGPAQRPAWEGEWFAGARSFKHMCVQPVIDIDGEEATAVSDYLMASSYGTPPEGGARVTVMGRYEDRLRLVGDRWLLVHRRMLASVPA
jgi:ketosteroid isomerase-like protein